MLITQGDKQCLGGYCLKSGALRFAGERRAWPAAAPRAGLPGHVAGDDGPLADHDLRRADVADTPQLRSSMRRAVARLQLDGLVRATRLLLAARTYADGISITRPVVVIYRPAARLLDHIPLIRFQQDVATASKRLG